MEVNEITLCQAEAVAILRWWELLEELNTEHPGLCLPMADSLDESILSKLEDFVS